MKTITEELRNGMAAIPKTLYPIHQLLQLAKILFSKDKNPKDFGINKQC